MPLELLITGVVGAVWVLAVVVVLRRRRPRREDRSIEAHHDALRALEAMRGRPIVISADLSRDDEPEEAQVWLIEDDHLPPPLPVVTPLLRDRLLPPLPVVTPPVRDRAQPDIRHPVVSALPTFGDGFGACDAETVPVTSREPQQWHPPRPGFRPAWRVAVLVGTLALVGVVAGSTVLGTGGHRRPRPVQEASVATVPAKPTPPPSTTVAAYPVTLGATGVQVQVPSGALVTFAAVERCWLEVTDGTRNLVFQGILQPGAIESVRVTDVLSARVGNAEAVQLTVEARPAPLPGVGPNPLDIALSTHPVT
jgi:hypothetical protein